MGLTCVFPNMFIPYDILVCIHSTIQDLCLLMLSRRLEDGIEPVRFASSLLDRTRNLSELSTDNHHVSSLAGRHPSHRHSIRVCLQSQ